MYTAKLKERGLEQGRFRWVVEFTDGAYTWTEAFIVPKYEELQDRIGQRLSELNFVDTFTIGADITPRTQAVLSQAELDRGVWLTDWRILQIADKLVAAGVIANTLPAYVAHKNKVINNFKVAYIPYL